MDQPHPPRRAGEAAVLRDDSVVREVATGETMSVADWLTGCAEGEGRSLEQCREELVNAVARGDLVVDETDS